MTDGPDRGPGPPPQPGIIPIRPLELGDVLGGAFRYIRSQPVVALVPALVVALILTPLQLAVQSSVLPAPGEPLPGFVDSFDVSFWEVLPLALAGMLVYPPMLALQFAVLVPAILGRRPTLGQAWATARPHLGRVYGVYLVFAIVSAVLSNGGIDTAVAVAGGGDGFAILLAVLIVLAAFAAETYMVVLLFPAVPAALLEGLGVRAALERSRALVRGAWWRMFGYQLVAALVAGAAALVVVIPLTIVMTVRTLSSGLGTAEAAGNDLLVFGAVGGIVGAVLTPYVVAAAGLVYLDQRFRRERYDLDLIRQL